MIDFYLEAHPNAVQDEDKAREMAEVSRVHEERIVEAAKDAVRFMGSVALDEKLNKTDPMVTRAMHRNGNLARCGQPTTYRQLVIQSLRDAQEAREAADQAAQRIANRYDLGSDELEVTFTQAKILKGGKSIPELME